MKENISMGTAVLAIVISIIAITSTVFVKPVSTISAGSVSGNELADNSVTSSKVSPNTLTDDDISDNGISKIADNAITLLHLSSAVIDAMTGVTDIADNSITSAKITDETITDDDINDSADIAPSKISGTAWTATNDGSDSGLDSDTLDGIDSEKFLRNDLSGTIDGNLIVSGDVTADEISVETITYSTPRTHYYSVGSEHFLPWSNIDYGNGGGCGGAFISSGTGGLAAPVNLPHGAIVTSMQVFFSDTSANDMSVSLTGQNLGSCGYFGMASLDSDDNSGYYSRTDTTISNNPIDNKNNAYYVGAYSTGWNSNLKVKGVVIAYTIDVV